MATQADYKAALQQIVDQSPQFLDNVNTILAYVDTLTSQSVVVTDATPAGPDLVTGS